MGPKLNNKKTSTSNHISLSNNLNNGPYSRIKLNMNDSLSFLRIFLNTEILYKYGKPLSNRLKKMENNIIFDEILEFFDPNKENKYNAIIDTKEKVSYTFLTTRYTIENLLEIMLVGTTPLDSKTLQIEKEKKNEGKEIKNIEFEKEKITVNNKNKNNNNNNNDNDIMNSKKRKKSIKPIIITSSQLLAFVAKNIKRKICGYTFKADEIAFSCRTCQKDISCVICQECFSNSNNIHDNHDVYFHRTSPGGCCDCGDPDAWNPSGFCCNHPGMSSDNSNNSNIQKKDDTEKNRIKNYLLPDLCNINNDALRNSYDSFFIPTLDNAASIVIEECTRFIYETILCIKNGLDFAKFLSKFVMDTLLNKTDSFDKYNQLIQRYQQMLLKKSKDKKETFPFHKYTLILHDDDFHSEKEVESLLEKLSISKVRAKNIICDIENWGSSIVYRGNIFDVWSKLPFFSAETQGEKGNIPSKKNFIISVRPEYTNNMIKTSVHVLTFLHRLSKTSDMLLNHIIKYALQTRNNRREGAGQADIKENKLWRANMKVFFTEHGVANTSFNYEMLKLLKLRFRNEPETTFEKWINNIKDATYPVFNSNSEKCQDVSSNITRKILGAPTIAYTNGNDRGAKKKKIPVKSSKKKRVISKVSISDNLPSLALDSGNEFIEAFIEGICTSVCGNTVTKKKFILTSAKKVFDEMKNDNQEPNYYSHNIVELLCKYRCYLPEKILEQSRGLFQELLADPFLKKEMFAIIMNNYLLLTSNYLKINNHSSADVLEFSVQLLNIPHLVLNYRNENNKRGGALEVLRILLLSLKMVLSCALVDDAETKTKKVFNVKHHAVTDPRYKFCADSIEFVCDIPELKDHLAGSQSELKELLDIWLEVLVIINNNNQQRRRGFKENHVEYTSDSYFHSFNLGIRIHYLYNHILQILYKKNQYEIIFHTVATSISMYYSKNVASKSIENFSESTFEKNNEKGFKIIPFNIFGDSVSFHIPIHRFLAAALQKHLLNNQNANIKNLFENDTNENNRFILLVEMPIRALVTCSSILANLWRRNGEENMMGQLHNYSALPFCIHYRDADIFLLQIGVLLLGSDYMISLLVEKYHLYSYFSCFNKDCYSSIEEGIDSDQLLLLVEEFLRLLIVIGTNLIPKKPENVSNVDDSNLLDYDFFFLCNNLVHNLCVKPCTFSKLSKLIVLPNGREVVDVVENRNNNKIKKALSIISDYKEPELLNPGIYHLKKNYFHYYNPYYLHLNKEKHVKARENWKRHRRSHKINKQSISSNCEDLFSVFFASANMNLIENNSKAPLVCPPRPINALVGVRNILISRSTIAILWSVLNKLRLNFKKIDKNVNKNDLFFETSEAVITTALHLLLYALYTAIDNDSACQSSINVNEFFDNILLIPKIDGPEPDICLLELLYYLKEKRVIFDDKEQKECLDYILMKIAVSNKKCQLEISEKYEKKYSPTSTVIKTSETKSKATKDKDSNKKKMTLDERKQKAKERALSMMAKQQAAFLEKANNTKSLSSLNSHHTAHLSNNNTHNRCILCHESSSPETLGSCGFLQESSVYYPTFRTDPYSFHALHAHAETVEKSKKYIRKRNRKMGLSSGDGRMPSTTIGNLQYINTNGNNDEDLFRFSSSYLGHYEDDDDDDIIMSDNSSGSSHSGESDSNNGDFIDGAEYVYGEEILIDDEDTDEMNETRVLDFLFAGAQESGQNSFTQNVVSNNFRRRRRAERRSGHLGQTNALTSINIPSTGGPILHLNRDRRQPINNKLASESNNRKKIKERKNNKLNMSLCCYTYTSCGHLLHLKCLENYTNSLHAKVAKGEDYEGMDAVDPEAPMFQFLCPLCKNISNILLPSLAMNLSQKTDPTLKSGNGDPLQLLAREATVTSSSLDSLSVASDMFDKKKTFSSNLPTIEGNEKIKPVSGSVESVSKTKEQHSLGIVTKSFDDTDEMSFLKQFLRDEKKLQLWCKSTKNGVTLFSDNNVDNYANVDSDHSGSRSGWIDYLEEFLWEPHGSIDKAVPYFWCATAYAISNYVYNKSNNISLTYNDADNKELLSMAILVNFSRAGVDLMTSGRKNHSNIILNIAKKCSPILFLSNREEKKINTMVDSADACVKNIVIGLLSADIFTSFIVSSALAKDYGIIKNLIYIFGMAKVFEEVYTTFFILKEVKDKTTENIFDKRKNLSESTEDIQKFRIFQDIVDELSRSVLSADDNVSPLENKKYNKKAIKKRKPNSTQKKNPIKKKNLQDKLENLERNLKITYKDTIDTVNIINILEWIYTQIKQKEKNISIESIYQNCDIDMKEFLILCNKIKIKHETYLNKLILFWKCLHHNGIKNNNIVISSSNILRSLSSEFQQSNNNNDSAEEWIHIFKWIEERILFRFKKSIDVDVSSTISPNHGIISKTPWKRCEHADGQCNSLLINMFVQRYHENIIQNKNLENYMNIEHINSNNTIKLIHLPERYDTLYSIYVNKKKCSNCNTIPIEPALCLICGILLCAGGGFSGGLGYSSVGSCCSQSYVKSGPLIGECTYHARECGGGVGIVLLLKQCRIALIGGNLAEYFPCIYVDENGEEDNGLIRCKPLLLSKERYEILQDKWRTNKIYTVISNIRNSNDPQRLINLAYL